MLTEIERDIEYELDIILADAGIKDPSNESLLWRREDLTEDSKEIEKLLLGDYEIYYDELVALSVDRNENNVERNCIDNILLQRQVESLRQALSVVFKKGYGV